MGVVCKVKGAPGALESSEFCLNGPEEAFLLPGGEQAEG